MDIGLNRKLWSISIPLLFVESVETLDHFIDTLFLGRVGLTELGALVVADSLMLIFLIFPLAVVDGMQLLTARRFGEKRPAAVGNAFNQGLIVTLGVAALATLFLKLFSPFFVSVFVKSAEVGVVVDSYLQLNAYSLCLTGITFSCGALLTSLGRTRALIPASLLFLATNVLFDYLFIFGKSGFPQLGMRGAAAGSIFAEGLTAVFLCLHVGKVVDHKRYRFFRLRHWDRELIGHLQKLSTPLMLQSVIEYGRWLIFFLIIERLGIPALATANVVFTCFLIMSIPLEGFSETVFSLTSRLLGEERTVNFLKLPGSASLATFLVALPFLLLALCFPGWIMSVFAQDDPLAGGGIVSLRVIALSMLLIIPAETWYATLIGTGDTVAAMLIEGLSSLTMIGLTCLLVFILHWSLPAIWLVLPATSLVCLATSLTWLQMGAWKRLEI